jgi:hypothetical protein
LHPYTAGLMASTVHGQPREHDIEAIPGSPADMCGLPPGCRLAAALFAADGGVPQHCATATLSGIRGNGRLPSFAARLTDAGPARRFTNRTTVVSNPAGI